MATQTSIATGLWSASGTWDGTVPADGDVVVISAGHTVTFDADQSAWVTGIDGLTITGTLTVQSATGAYYMMIKAAKTIAGAGTFNVGTLATPIPFQTKFTLTGGAGWYINGAGGLTMTVYAAEPTIKTILLSGDEAIGQTELSVDTDVTGDIWAVGDTIRIDDINKAAESEERVIAAGGIASGAITITAGLTAAKSTGAVMHLMTRNVRFIGVTSAHLLQNFASEKLTIAGGYFNHSSFRIMTGSTATISGGTFTAGYLFQTSTLTISGGVFSGVSTYVFWYCTVNITGGYFSGCDQVFNSCSISFSNATVKGGTYAFFSCYSTVINSGTFYGLATLLYLCPGFLINGGTFTGLTQGPYDSSGKINNAAMSSNTRDVNRATFTAYNSIFGSATENYAYTSLAKESYSESIDHDQVAGAYKAWTKGGVTTKQATTYPTGYTYSYQTVLENASVEGYWQREVNVGAGASVNVTMWLRKTASMTYLPRIQVFLKSGTDPFSGGTPLHTFTMTDSTDTFENDLYTYTNSTSEDITLVCRAQGMNASGSVFSVMDVEQINVDLTTALAAIAAVKADTAAVLEDTGTTIPASIAALPTAASILGTEIETGYDMKEVLQIIAAAVAGKASGGGTTSITFRDLADSANRIVEVVDSSGNRTSVTLTTAS